MTPSQPNLEACFGIDLRMIITAAYSSSKAALCNLSETLRLELSPFGVSVVTIMTGVVTTQFHENDAFSLPQTSRYAVIKEIISSWANGKAKPKGCSAEQFAESLLEDIVGKGKGGVVWKGPHAGAIKAMVKWLPASLGVSLSSHIFPVHSMSVSSKAIMFTSGLTLYK